MEFKLNHLGLSTSVSIRINRIIMEFKYRINRSDFEQFIELIES